VVKTVVDIQAKPRKTAHYFLGIDAKNWLLGVICFPKALPTVCFQPEALNEA
jgi:hypothetical protein